MKTGVKYSVIWLLSLFCYTEASFRCSYYYSVSTKGWFNYVVVPATWADARLRCLMEGAILASPLHKEHANEMQQMMTNFSTVDSEIFTGVYAISKGNFYTVDGELSLLSQDHIVWAQGEPNNLNNSEQCITFNGYGKLADRSCDVPKPYICFRKDKKDVVNLECESMDPEYTLDKRTGSCYKVHTVPRTFERAHFACAAEGGHLAIINNEVEATVLKELLAKYPDSKMIGAFRKDVAFIGFHDWGERGEWRTIHGQTLTQAGYDAFASGEPNNSTPGEFCGSIYRSGLLNDLLCEKPVAFICEKNPKYPRLCRPCTGE